jgi:hypothetical protein
MELVHGKIHVHLLITIKMNMYLLHVLDGILPQSHLLLLSEVEVVERLVLLLQVVSKIKLPMSLRVA